MDINIKSAILQSTNLVPKQKLNKIKAGISSREKTAYQIWGGTHDHYHVLEQK